MRRITVDRSVLRICGEQMNIISGSENTEVIAEFTRRVSTGKYTEMAVEVDGVKGTAVFNIPVNGMMYISCDEPRGGNSKYEPDRVMYFRPMVGVYAVHPVSVFREMFARKEYKVS